MLGHWNHSKTKRSYFDAKNPKSIKVINQNEYGGKETFLARRHIHNHRESKDLHSFLNNRRFEAKCDSVYSISVEKSIRFLSIYRMEIARTKTQPCVSEAKDKRGS